MRLVYVAILINIGSSNLGFLVEILPFFYLTNSAKNSDGNARVIFISSTFDGGEGLT